MATGDDGVLGGMPLTPGSLPANELDTELNKVHDYIANGATHWKPGVTLPLSRGGLGATNAADARTALGLAAADTAATGDTLVKRYPGGEIDAKQFATANDPVTGNHCTRRSWVEARIAAAVGSVDLSSRVAKAGDTMSGHLYLPNSVAATSGYTIAYINGDGRVSRGASSERYKDDITPIDPSLLGDIFPQLHTFVMKDDPGRMTRVGYIAERLQEHDDTRAFVIHAREPVYEDIYVDIYDEAGAFVEKRLVDRRVIGSQRALDEAGNPIPDSIDFVALLLAQVAQLHQRVAELEAR